MKPNIILLHGALGTKEQLNPLKQQLSNEFQVHVFNFEGHGNKATSKDFTIELFTDNVVDYMKANNLESTHLFGYSMGGYVALNLAQQHPQLVDKIVTLGTKFAWNKATAEKEMKLLNPEKIADKVPAFAQMLASIHTNNDWKMVVEKTANMMYALGTGAKIKATTLSQIEQKVLIGIGDQDHMVSIAESKETADLLPNGSLKIIEGFQHPIDKIDVEKLSSIIKTFIKGSN